MFERLKSNADRLAAEAGWLRRERNAHARRGYAIFRRRIGSPPGLAACFGAGVFAGARSRHRDVDREEPARPAGRRSEHTASGFTERLLHGPLGAAALRFGTAFLAGALVHPEHAHGGTDADTAV